MKINYIQMKNYRQYKNEKIRFDKNRNSKLNIIIAKNGVGKTNFLNAITWCLYEDESHLGIQSKSLAILNLDTLGDLNEGDSETVEIEIEFQFDGIKYIANRSVVCVKQPAMENGIYPNPSKYTLTIYNTNESDDLPKTKNGQEATVYMNRFFPKSIHEYFFFDNEQLDSYLVENESETIKLAIHELSQVELLSSAKRHLTKVADEYRQLVKKGNPNLELKYKEFEQAEINANEIEKSMTKIKKQISTSKAIVIENKKITSKAPDIKALDEELEALNRNKEELLLSKKEKLTELREFIKEFTILLRLYPELNKTLDFINEQENLGKLPTTISLELLKDSIEDKECKVCKNHLDKSSMELLLAEINKIKLSNESSNLLIQVRTEITRMINKAKTYMQIKEKINNEYKKIEDELKLVLKKISEIKDVLSKRTDNEKIKKLIFEIQEHEGLIETNNEKLTIQKEYCKQASIKAIEAKTAYDKAAKKVSQYKELSILVEFSENALNIINESEDELIKDMKSRISEKTYNIFSSLIWKSNTFSKVLITDNYNLDIMHFKGYPCIGSCSAAERALLALSFTLALHDISGVSAPLVIDSPVGRVSDENRKNFAEILFDVSKRKQIIMLFTPSEYSEEVESTFKDKLGSFYNIEMIDDTESNIKEGEYNGR